MFFLVNKYSFSCFLCSFLSLLFFCIPFSCLFLLFFLLLFLSHSLLWSLLKDPQGRVKKRRPRPHSAWLAPALTPEPDGVVLYPERHWGGSSEFQVRAGHRHSQDSQDSQGSHSRSPDSAGSLGYCSGVSSPENRNAGEMLTG